MAVRGSRPVRRAGNWKQAGLGGEEFSLFVVSRTTFVLCVGFFVKNVLKRWEKVCIPSILLW